MHVAHLSVDRVANKEIRKATHIHLQIGKDTVHIHTMASSKALQSSNTAVKLSRERKIVGSCLTDENGSAYVVILVLWWCPND